MTQLFSTVGQSQSFNGRIGTNISHNFFDWKHSILLQLYNFCLNDLIVTFPKQVYWILLVRNSNWTQVQIRGQIHLKYSILQKDFHTTNTAKQIIS